MEPVTLDSYAKPHKTRKTKMATNHQVDGTQKDTTTDGMEPIQLRNEDGMELAYGGMEPKATVMGWNQWIKAWLHTPPHPPHPSH